MEWHGLPALGCDVQGLVITFGGTCGKSGARNPDKTRQIGVISQKRGKFFIGIWEKPGGHHCSLLNLSAHGSKNELYVSVCVLIHMLVARDW